MSLESEMFSYLSGEMPSVDSRIYPMGKRPQGGELPAVTYQLVSGPTSHYSHAGVSDYEASYQFDCWADDADEAMDVAAELQTALDGYRGAWGSILIGSVFLDIVLDDYEPDTGLYRRLRQASIHYSTPLGS